MANLPGNIYAGGAVTLNSTPYVQYYLQSKAREQAKKEAIDKFYMDMGKSLTPTGVYSNDIPLFIDKKNQWQQHAMDNKDILNNPRHPQYAEKVAENSYLYNDAASIPELSKSKVKNFEEYMSAVKPNMKNVTEDTIEYGSKILAPLGQNAPLDLTRISYTPELFDAKNQDAFLKTAMSNVKPDRTFGEPKIDAKSHQVINPYTDAYSTEGKQKIATNAALVYDNDKAAQAYFENEFHEHDADYENFNKAFKEYFKRDIASPKDAAIGWALSHAGIEEKGEQRAAYNPFAGQHSTIYIGGQPPVNPNADNSTEFDRVGTIDPLVFPKSGVILKEGQARDKNGNLYSGDLTTTGDRLPAGLKTVLKSGGYDFTDADKTDYFTFKVKDGRIEAIKPSGGSWIDRQDLVNFQLKSNSEPQKSQQPIYGNKGVPVKKQQQNKPATGGFKLPQNFHP